MASTVRPQQFATWSCVGSTSPSTTSFVDFGFNAGSVVFANDGPDPIYISLNTTTSACSTSAGFRVASGESQTWSGQIMPMALLTTTSSAASAYRIGAWRW